MSSRRITPVLALAALAALALPATALANPQQDAVSVTPEQTEVSAVDAVASDVSVDGSADTVSDSSSDEASDSPTVDAYNPPDDELPPPCEDDPKCDPPVGDPCLEDVAGGGVGGDLPDPTCGGGPVEEPPVVDGGGDVPDVPALPALESVPDVTAAGGGGPELPFTGMPLWYAMFAGGLLVLAGAGFWMRARIVGTDAA